MSTLTPTVAPISPSLRSSADNIVTRLRSIFERLREAVYHVHGNAPQEGGSAPPLPQNQSTTSLPVAMSVETAHNVLDNIISELSRLEDSL